MKLVRKKSKKNKTITGAKANIYVNGRLIGECTGASLVYGESPKQIPTLGRYTGPKKGSVSCRLLKLDPEVAQRLSKSKKDEK